MDIRSEFVRAAPSRQNAVDIFAGSWVSMFPDEAGVVSGGSMQLFDDPRLHWIIQRLGPLNGATVLELGPLEGAHSWMLQAAGCERVVAIESNPHAFLKCLVTKEVMGLDRVEFECGDFVQYLRAAPERFDAVIASGVLYHMADPVELVHRVADVTPRVGLWTHLYDADAFEQRPDLDELFVGHEPATSEGLEHTVHRRQYRKDGIAWDTFHGGKEETPGWLTKDDLTRALHHAGFTAIEFGVEQHDHPHGPALAAVAR